MQRARQRNEDY